MVNFPDKYNPKDSEKKWQEWWENEGIYKFDSESDKPVYSIDMPPPYISGDVHVGHAMSYSQAEFIARFWRMREFNLFYPMGFDDNGLPTERFVEKKYKILSKSMTQPEFVKLCLEETKKGGDEYRKIWTTLGISVDWSLLYSTIDDRCRKVSQLSFIDLFRKDRLKRVEEPVIWCPQCQTALAQADLEDKEEESFLNTIYFELEDKKKIEIATSRPELLPACVGIFAHPDDKRYTSLIGKKAKVPIFGQEVPIMKDAQVDPEFGTGLVMICTFGDKTDIEWWKEHKLPLRIAIDEKGILNELSGEYKGKHISKARREILEDLQKQGLLKEQKKILHVLNVDERCGTPVEFIMKPQWFIKILDLKEKLIEQGNKINWYPEFMHKRYDTWIDGLKWDWCISRQRFYGIPFPVWYCKKCGEIILAEKEDLPVYPTIDKPTKKCKCGSSDFKPEMDVMDTWMNSSLTPLINARWGFKENFMEKIYPMSLRPQAHEIIRTWAFYTILKSYLHTNTIPWKDIMISGHGLDPSGKKMSKSKGNIVKPLDIVDKYSADALRWWSSNTILGQDLMYQEKDVVSGQKFLTKLWNACRFSSQFLDEVKEPELRVIDYWILHKMNEVVQVSTDSFEKYEYSRAKKAIETFFWHDLCDNYLEIAKTRLYSEKDNSGKKAAQYTLGKVLLTSLKLLAPFIPHITEDIYQNLFLKQEGAKSIHISSWPTYKKELKNSEAEKLGDCAVEIIAQVRQFKTSQNLSQGAEIQKILIQADENVEPIIEDIKSTCRAKEIEIKKGKALQVEVLN